MGLLYSHYEANPITNIKVNAVSGTLQKTFRNSYFVRFQKGSPDEKYYFNKEKPSKIIETSRYSYSDKDYENYMYEYDSNKDLYYKLKEIVVLQIMLCADDNYLVEVIDKKDYDEIFELLDKGE